VYSSEESFPVCSFFLTFEFNFQSDVPFVCFGFFGPPNLDETFFIPFLYGATGGTISLFPDRLLSWSLSKGGDSKAQLTIQDLTGADPCWNALDKLPFFSSFGV